MLPMHPHIIVLHANATRELLMHMDLQGTWSMSKHSHALQTLHTPRLCVCAG